ncbi:MAG TPA: proton-conducting membrane transporter [Thermotogae bacterium]|nr:NADH-quinone oxidoreductase subunit [Thermotogota bacterium]HCZ07217.1 proton-conducting membrane transporter [Thermotogota bacterium]
MKILESAAVIITGIVFGLFLLGVQRKLVARVQRRYGPPIWQQFIDVAKLFSKSSISHGFVFDMGVMMALGGTIATLLFVPIGKLQVLSMSGDFIVVVYLMAVASLGMAMSAVNSGNPNASIGVMRALTQMFGYELPYLMVMMGMMFAYRTSSILGMAQVQQGGILNWNLFRVPIGAIVVFISMFGISGKKPFDTPIAPAEIASGPMVEYSGKFLGSLTLMHALVIFVDISIFVNVFLGGASNYWFFLLKVLAVFSLMVLISSVIPRFRVEQVVTFSWKWPLFFAVIQSVILVAMGVR